MASRSTRFRRLAAGLQAISLAAFVAAMSPSGARATTYDEAVQGDLSDSASSPTSMGDLAAGSNRISGTTIPRGIFDPSTHAYSVVDNDYVTFRVPTGDVLSTILLDTDSIIQASDRLFLGIARGVGVSVDPSFSSAAGLLGWTLAGGSSVGSDVLAALGSAAPGDFPPIPGAEGFTGPLGSGEYTLWILDGDAPVVYDFELTTVAAVPEPSQWLLLLGGMAVMGRAFQRRRRTVDRGSRDRTAGDIRSRASVDSAGNS